MTHANNTMYTGLGDVDYDPEMFSRPLCDAEAAELPKNWEYPVPVRIWEVDEYTYNESRKLGYFCQVHDGKFYIAR